MRPTTSTPLTQRLAIREEDLSADRSSLRSAAADLIRPAPAGVLVASALMLLACNVNERIGHRYVTFKHFYVHTFLLCLLLATAYWSASISRASWTSLAARAARTLCWFLPFCFLIGAGALISNGTIYQAMATNFWGTDVFSSTSRRIGLPALANVLGVEAHGYVYFWYVVLFASFGSVLRFLEQFHLGRLETFSLLTSTIFAYSLIGPGYNEIFVFLLGLIAIQIRMNLCVKILTATLMIATHETATLLVAGAIVLSSEQDERAEWISTFVLLYSVYVATYLFTWREDIFEALTRAGRPAADSSDDAVSLALHHPFGMLFGVFMAYKLYWSVVALGIARKRTRAMGVMACASIVLAVIGTDTSRLVQFGSLAFLSVTGSVLSTLDNRMRIALALANLVVPSVYVATNALVNDRVVPLWGRGLYSLYFHATQIAGVEWGVLFVP